VKTRQHAVVCVSMFAVGLFVGSLVLSDSPSASAQNAGLDGPPVRTVVAGSKDKSNINSFRVWRFWNDGGVDMAIVRFEDATSCVQKNPWFCMSEILSPIANAQSAGLNGSPVRSVVDGRTERVFLDFYRIWRFWNDGSVDMTVVNFEVPGSCVQAPGFCMTPILPSGCPADLDGSGDVGFADLIAILSAWGPCPGVPGDCPEDIDGSGDVGLTDLIQLLAAWGPCL
jgi:hypothetical protein